MQQTLIPQDLLTIYKPDIERMDDGMLKPLIIKNVKYKAADGSMRQVLPDHYKDIWFEPDWMILRFSNEEDKKSLYNIFHNNGMRVPLHYDKDQALTVYYNGPRSIDCIEPPDVIIDNDVVDINLKWNPTKTLSILEKYFEQKNNLLRKRSGPDGI